jgi:hypothetical protein
MFRVKRSWPLALLAIAITTAPVYGQVDSASVQGTVTDAAGATIASATITVKNMSTGITTTLQTNSKGFYNFTQLQIGGPYSVEISAPGFKGYKTEIATLNINQKDSVNAKLDVGSTAESVQVTAINGQVDTADTQLQTTLSSHEIEQLPLFGRDASGLQKFQAGSVESSDRFGTSSANGSQTASNSFVLDGVDINDGPLQTNGFRISPDALQEQTIISSSLNPQYARNSGAVVNQVIKSGTNQIHGSGFYYYRDTFLNNGNYFSKPGTRPPFHQNEYGGTVGGPILPNKLFFFLSYQGLRNKTGSTTNTPVPSATELAGNFGPLVGSSAKTVTPFAIGSCPAGSLWSSCFGNGQAIPTSAFNAISQKLVQQYVPAPNETLGINNLPYYNFSTANTGAQDQGVVRLDYHLSQRDQIYATSVFQSSPSTETLPFTGATLPGFGEVDAAHRKVFDADYVHTFSASLVNELNVGYYRFNYAAVEPQQNVQPSSVGFAINPQSSSSSLPYVSVQSLFALGFSTNGPQPRKDSNFKGTDTFTLVKGNHTVKLGASVEQFRVSNPFFGNNNGNYAFNGGGTFSSGNPLADFLLGIPDSYSQGSGGFIDALAYENYFYVQDAWKATSDLEVNYGAALDIETPNKNRQYGGLGIVCFTLAGTLTQQFQGANAPPGLLYPGDPGCNSYGGTTVKYDHVAPKIGFAYSPSSGPAFLIGNPGDHAFSIRGGFGIYFNRDQEEGSLQNLSAPPFSLTSQPRNPSFGNPYQPVNGGATAVNPFPFTPAGKGASLTWSNYTPLDINSFDKSYDVPYVYNFNVNIQRQLPSKVLLQVAYVGSLGHKLLITKEGDPITPAGHNACVADVNGCALDPYTHFDYPQYTAQPAINPDNQEPDFLSVGTQATEGSSNYNSLQVTATKTTTHGLFASAAYTYSKGLDNGSGLESSGFNGRGYNQYPGYAHLNYGPSDYDARHRLALLYVYSVPVYNTSNYLLREAVSGWQISGETALQSGNPIQFSEVDGNYYSKWCDAYSYYYCPDTPNTSSFNISKLNIRKPGNQLFNAALFSPEALGTFGNVGRGLLSGPGFNYTNISIAKNFPLSREGERNFQLRMDVSNAFNHANFSQPDSNFGDAQFGQITSVISSADPNQDPQPARAVELVGRFSF